MQNKSLTYQAYTPGDEEGIVELLRSVFTKWRLINNPLVYWTWKYLEAPQSSEVSVAKDGEQVVGVEHRLVLDIKIGDSILRSHYIDDLAVYPDYRRLGVWKNLKNMADEKQIEKEVKFSYLATENLIVKEYITRMGFNPSKHYIAHLLNIRDQELYLKRKQRDDFVTRVGVSALTGWSGVKQFFSSKPDRNEDFSIIDIDRFDYRIDGFWDKVKDDYGYCIVKKSDYLNWKYSRPSISEHRIRLAMRGEEVLGFSALGLREDGDYKEGSISDLLTLPKRLDVANALIIDACEHFNYENVAATYFQATKGHPYEGLAERNGFIDVSSQNNSYFYYAIVNNSIPTDYLENLDPSKVQLNHF